MEKCKNWSDCAGLMDPVVVVQYCVSLLHRDVYPNMIWTKFDVECSKAKPRDPCDGIKIYLEKLDCDPIICEEVKYYIKHPCKDEMKRAINKSSRKALLFMLEYLKLRGPFIQWILDGSVGSINSISKSRCVIRYATSYLEGLLEQDQIAFVILGRYLQYVLSVCYAHEMFFMKDVLSKVYAPLFIEMKISKDMQTKVSISKGIDYSIYIFKKMLENCPWCQYSPSESIIRCIYPSMKREFSHKYEELAQYIYNKTKLPSELKENVGEIMYQNKILCPTEDMRDDRLKHVDQCERSETDINSFVPDNCQINYDHFNTNNVKRVI